MSNIAWIAIGTAFTILGAIIIGIFTFREGRDNADQNKKLTSTIDNQSTRIEHLTDQNTSLVTQLAETSKKLEGQITGGNSYCTSLILPRTAHSGLISFTHAGDFPMYDVKARVVDIAVFNNFVKKSKNFTIDNVTTGSTNFDIGNLSSDKASGASGGTGFYPFESDFSTGFAAYNIFYSARNGYFTEMVRLFRKAPKQWLRAVRVTSGLGTDSTLFEHIDEGFPNEKIDWLKTPPVPQQEP